MRFNLPRLIVLFTCLYSGYSYAAEYAQMGLSQVRYQNKGFSDSNVETSQQVASLTLGYEFERKVSVEFMTGVAQLENKPVKINGSEVTDVKIDFKRAFAIYAKKEFSLTPSFDINFKIGYAYIKGQGAYHDYAESVKGSGLSYGGGVKFSLNNKTYIFADYSSILKYDDLKIKGVTAGLGYYF